MILGSGIHSYLSLEYQLHWVWDWVKFSNLNGILFSFHLQSQFANTESSQHVLRHSQVVSPYIFPVNTSIPSLLDYWMGHFQNLSCVLLAWQFDPSLEAHHQEGLRPELMKGIFDLEHVRICLTLEFLLLLNESKIPTHTASTN